MTALGITASAKGEISVGIGGSAKFGLTGGKVRCELGIAVGLGVKVSFDLDVGGAVSAVKNAVSYAAKYTNVETLKKAGQKVWDVLTSW